MTTKNAVFTVLFLLSLVQLFAQAPKSIEGNRHEFVRKGDHEKEIRLGNYVVIARTLTEADAIKLIDELKKMNLPIPSYGYQSGQSYWYIYFDATDDIEQAQQKRDEYKKHDMYKSAYLLTIHQ